MNSNKVKTGGDMLELKLRELYDLESQVVKALGKLAKKANDEELRAGFEQHQQETQEQIIRLEQVFKILDTKPRKVKLEGIRGILNDGESMLSRDTSEEVHDVLMATAARKVEHYEMACYLAAGELASQLGHTEIEELLQESLAEEAAADKQLSHVAERLNEALLERGNMSPTATE